MNTEPHHNVSHVFERSINAATQHIGSSFRKLGFGMSEAWKDTHVFDMIHDWIYALCILKKVFAHDLIFPCPST